MGRHVKLPPSTEAAPKPQPKTFTGTQAVVEERVTRVVEVNDFVYCIRVKLEGSALAGFIFLTNKKQFTQVELEEMTAEAVKICNEVRIPNRRKMMADEKTPCENPAKINETLFEGDVDFVEGVMCDKWRFRKLILMSAMGEVVPTIKI